MTRSRRRRLAGWGLFIALASVLILQPVGPVATDRDLAPVAAAAAVSAGVAGDHVDPAVLPRRPMPLASAAGEHRAPRATSLLAAALLAAAVALAVWLGVRTCPVATGAPALTRRRNCIGLRAPPSLQPA